MILYINLYKFHIDQSNSLKAFMSRVRDLEEHVTRMRAEMISLNILYG